MKRSNEPLRDESDRALDRAIRAVMAQPAPEEVKNRVIQTALGFTAGGPSAFHDNLYDNIRT